MLRISPSLQLGTSTVRMQNVISSVRRWVYMSVAISVAICSHDWYKHILTITYHALGICHVFLKELQLLVLRQIVVMQASNFGQSNLLFRETHAGYRGGGEPSCTKGNRENSECPGLHSWFCCNHYGLNSTPNTELKKFEIWIQIMELISVKWKIKKKISSKILIVVGQSERRMDK